LTQNLKSKFISEIISWFDDVTCILKCGRRARCFRLADILRSPLSRRLEWRQCWSDRPQSRQCRPVVNFTSILQVAFVLIFFCQKTTKPKCNKRKAAQKTFTQKGAHKMLMKFTPWVNFTNILQRDLQAISFRQKIKKPNCKYIKAASSAVLMHRQGKTIYF